jgi:hypothetical protein
VKVAILDTGVQISTDWLRGVYEGRLKECRTWLTTENPEGEEFELGTRDSDGHGTHGTSVLLDVTRSADVHVYAAQVFNKREEKVIVEFEEDDLNVKRIVDVSTEAPYALLLLTHTQAIDYAVTVWGVNVICMAFGCSDRVPAIEEAISRAYQKNILMLSAASNDGANNQVTWPARDDRVLCIYASTGIGNKYSRNPTPRKSKSNLATLGTAVLGLWPNQSTHVRRSGTSTATVICAAIAATVMAIMRRSEDDYIAAFSLINRKQSRIDRQRRDYKAKLQVIGRASNMSDILQLMVKDGIVRDEYSYVAPWNIFNDNKSTISIIEAILEAIDA